jgi:hypothetical protein
LSSLEEIKPLRLDGVGEIYNGPPKFIIPWVSSFSPGLHRLKITVDGQEMANDSYMQRQLMFERPFPNSTDVVAGDVAITNTFGWTTDGALPSMRSLPLSAASSGRLGGPSTAAQFAPKNFNQPTSAFTLNTLRETITKSVSAPDPFQAPARWPKSWWPTKPWATASWLTLRATPTTKIRGNGSVPGFKRLAMVSNCASDPQPGWR